ncbi:type I restriction modification DNA specificity domain protein [Burkholderia thailandensis E264]|nr:restriction endonuclease subunit S [Burkholderia thailandensis]AHI73893.1 type I restriction modification DNA specificity domain protein [Burkholderia thailandensis 2002721723]AIP24336.1 type I restriction modification DNA specificity domain protein [Burkholderia thailandensis E264]AJX98496.1 type I restriction modification DNA specificity domain protein [Burkholderia thailandensis 2002721643]NBC94606.1 restriction endonuclease subunit S [Burkholderia thailandensis]PHH35379.1 restriction en
MASEWQETTIGDAFEVNPSRLIKRGGVAPFIPMDALPVHARSVERIETREFTGSGTRFQNGDTLIARITPCLENGKTAYISELPEGVVAHGSTEYIVLSGKVNQSDSLFGYYLVRSPDFRRHAIGHMEGTSGRQRVPSSAVERYSTRLPPLAEQRAIAKILGSLDDKIELNRERSETLEAMGRALFKDWFVDFGPVRAKQEGRSPYLPREIWDLFPERLDTNELPEGWKLLKASELIEFNPTESLRKGEVAPYLDMASLPTQGSWPDPYVMRPFGSGMRFRNGDTLLARITPCLENGKTAFIQCLPDDVVGWGSTEYIVMRPKGPVPAAFAYLLARNDAFREHAIRSMTGTSGRQRAQGDAVAAYQLAAPLWDDKLWAVLASIVSLLFDGIRSNSETSVNLAKMRDNLLPMLIAGALRVKNAERILGAAT